MQAEGAPFGLCVKKIEGRHGLNVEFIDDGLAGMLKAADIYKLDMI